MKSSLPRRAGVIAAVVAAVVLAVAGPASAHVTVNPDTATQGGYTKVSFRVPTESDTASTTRLEVDLPVDTPVASVSTRPVTGWTAVTTKAKLAKPITTDDGQITEAVSKIVWTASSGAEIKPGQFQEFDVSLGPLPTTVNQLIFKALQTYSDGSIVRWIDLPNADGSEPDHPAPILKLTAGAAASAASAPAAVPTVTVADETSDGNAGLGWGIAGFVVAVIALVLGLAAYRRSGQTRA